MKDALGNTLSNGDLVAYSPQSNYIMRIAIIVDAKKHLILSGVCNDDGTVGIMSRTGVAISDRLLLLASRHETDDYESINDDFLDRLESMGIEI